MGMGMGQPQQEGARGKSWVDAELPYVFIGWATSLLSTETDPVPSRLLTHPGPARLAATCNSYSTRR